MPEASDDQVSRLVGEMVGEFLAVAAGVPPDELPKLGERIAGRLGVTRLTVWLVDYQQRVLVPFPAAGETPVGIDDSVAGRAFIRAELAEVTKGRETTLWLPLVDGTDRIGVLEAIVDSPDSATRAVLVNFAHAVAGETIVRGRYTDAFKRARRRHNMTLSAELQWQLLPPTTFRTPDVSISGVLEPAYDVGGDTFDYAYSDGMLQFMILDAVGHDLDSSFYAALSVGSYRHARRSGIDLQRTVSELDSVIHDQFEGTTFATAQLCELDVATGILQWVNAGHPSPVLIRNGLAVGTLDGRRRVPLGVGHLAGAEKYAAVAEEHLEPGDMLLFYSDGVVEARTPRGTDFGMERLRAFVEEAVSSELPLAEITRQLGHAILDHHGGALQDDATIVLVHWHPNRSDVRVA
jgi:Stage II sporulation protein E (SpoIIE)